ncbi:uncharacterized protein EV154DRAFT_480618 [Mucor mucedo]|uniref:uncharacterized protein n=1 Tax=Mucor mucedo TaxID=29922 RepID=UPI00221FDADA|nr:uncharacterized protein EV154DRAFT_480618 [Mucor mucedo]KAI7892004.1 hypothetical protein EV154DRAFT_480618 [Mucor mucedo]
MYNVSFEEQVRGINLQMTFSGKTHRTFSASTPQSPILICHFSDDFGQERQWQYAAEASDDITYDQVRKKLDESKRSYKTLTYSRGEKAPLVIINNDESLNLAVRYFKKLTPSDEIHLFAHQ